MPSFYRSSRSPSRSRGAGKAPARSHRGTAGDRPQEKAVLSLQRSAGNRAVLDLISRSTEGAGARSLQRHLRPYRHTHGAGEEELLGGEEEEMYEGEGAGSMRESLLPQAAGRLEVLKGKAGVAAEKRGRQAKAAKKVYSASGEQSERTKTGKALKYAGYATSAASKAFPPAAPLDYAVTGAQKLHQGVHARELVQSGHVTPLLAESEADYEAQEGLGEMLGRGLRSEEEFEED